MDEPPPPQAISRNLGLPNHREGGIGGLRLVKWPLGFQAPVSQYGTMQMRMAKQLGAPIKGYQRIMGRMLNV